MFRNSLRNILRIKCRTYNSSNKVLSFSIATDSFASEPANGSLERQIKNMNKIVVKYIICLLNFLVINGAIKSGNKIERYSFL